MPPGAVGRAERGYAIPTPRTGGPIIVIPSDAVQTTILTVIPSEAVQSAAEHRGGEEPVLQRRAATPLMLLRHGVERLDTDVHPRWKACCGMTSGALWKAV